MPKLTIYNPDGTSIKYGLNGKSFTVGRAETNDIVLPGGSASNHHAVLKSSDSGDFVVTDFDSTNHTRVNGEVVQSRTLKDGDELHFGDIAALYSSDARGDTPHRAAPKFEEDEGEEEAPAPKTPKKKAVAKDEVEEEEEDSGEGGNKVKVVRPAARRGPAGPAGPGGLVQAPPAAGQGMSTGEGCFAMLLLLLVVGAAFIVGVWMRHSRDHQGQTLPDYVAEWRADAAQAKAAEPVK